MPIPVRVGDSQWVCIGVTCIDHGCASTATSRPRTGTVCEVRQDSPHMDLKYGDRLRSGAPGAPLVIRLSVENMLDARTLALTLRGSLHTLAGNIGNRMVDHFMAGNAGCYVHGAGSELHGIAQRDSSYRRAKSDILRLLRATLARQLGAPRREYDCAIEEQHLPWITFSAWRAAAAAAAHAAGIGRRYPIGAVIGGTKGFKAFLRNLTLDQSRTRRTTEFRFDLRVEICDHFGADDGDHYTPGLRALWLLQHARRGRQKPFVNLIVVEEQASITFPFRLHRSRR